MKKYFTQNITIASNPKEAFPLIRQIKPDLLFVNIEMPYMKGDEMLEILRNMEEFENIKVIVYSSVVDKKTVKAVNKNRIVDFINKGADQKIIINKLNKHFGLVDKNEIPKKDKII